MAGERRIWHNMKARCERADHDSFPLYGGRGIAVCARWQSFEAFLADMGPRPSSSHSIDRIDNDRGYEPGNCRWATPTEQGRNRRDNRLVTYSGREMTIAEAAELAGIVPARVAISRVYAGWTIGRAVSEPFDDTATLREKMLAGRARKALAGGFASGFAPYGFRRAGRGVLEARTDEAEIVRCMFAWRAHGAVLQTIADRLNAEGYRTRKGGIWRAGTVSYVLKNPRSRQLVG